MGAVGGIIAVIFGIFWTIVAFTIGREAKSHFNDDATDIFAIVFPLFGVVFVIVGIANVIYNAYNATGEKRFSWFDITSSDEEPDLLNELVHNRGGAKTDTAKPDTFKPETLESRLDKLDTLLRQGAITESEHRIQRQRILDSL